MIGDGRALRPDQEAEILQAIQLPPAKKLKLLSSLWSSELLASGLREHFGLVLSDRTVDHYLERWKLAFAKPQLVSEDRRRWRRNTYPGLVRRASAAKAEIVWVGDRCWQGPGAAEGLRLIYAVNNRNKSRWLAYQPPLGAETLIGFLDALRREIGRNVILLMDGLRLERVRAVQDWLAAHAGAIESFEIPADPGPTIRATGGTARPTPEKKCRPPQSNLKNGEDGKAMTLTHLQRLEAESIHIMREVVAEADNPVMLYSIGKDSAVMLHLALKAFYPAKLPFPLLHVDTTWKFREMYAFRDRMTRELGLDLKVHVNPEGLEMKINPFTHGSAIHTDIMKTQGLKQALDKYGFDAAFGGARRDEEKSRAKERIFSFRSAQHRWDPKSQRPELWNIYNVRKHKGESIRVFPLSNWTELDIWQYIYLENVPIVPLYYAKVRPVVERDGALILLDDDRMPLKPAEVPMMRSVRFRTLGCYPLTGAVESTADTLPAIIQEMLLTKTSERQGRVIDHDQAASMEKKKQEGYF